MTTDTNITAAYTNAWAAVDALIKMQEEKANSVQLTGDLSETVTLRREIHRLKALRGQIHAA